ncbi:hypothetical protein GCM10010277_65320 [Streptomyces longisporoflavus]|nr:hypothetical protein GCM10010277_65320 [Streptomyces longisporoflavus]
MLRPSGAAHAHGGAVERAGGAAHPLNTRKGPGTRVPGPFRVLPLLTCPGPYLFRLAQNSSKERRLSLSASFVPITASATVSVT